MGESIKEVERKLELGAGELLLIFLILLNILEFSGFLTHDLDYVKKIVSWAALGYLLYKADLTEVFFGYKDRLIDASLIIAYFLLIMKNFVAFSKAALAEIGSSGDSFLVPLYQLIAENSLAFEMWTFYAGAIILILIASLNLVLNFEVRRPSLMGMIHEEGPPSGAGDRLARTVMSLVIFVAFFILVFNLVMEWLAWVIDSPILVIAIFFYFFVFLKYYSRFDTANFIYRVGNVGSGFYRNAIRLFHSRRTIMTGMAGILVLHLITDAGVFLLPYVTGKRISYFAELGAGHQTIISLASSSLASLQSLWPKALAILGYALNSIAAVFLLLGPAFIWYELYTRKRVDVPRPVYLVFYSSIAYLALNPVFSMKKLSLGSVGGVDIATHALNSGSLGLHAAIAAGAGIAALIMACIPVVRKLVKYLIFLIVSLFFAYYIFLFSVDIGRFYVNALSSGLPLLVAFFFVLFLCANVLFYLCGGLYFVYAALWKLHKKEL